MLKTHTIQGAAEGPRFLLTGAVHGNEKCGTAAIGRLLMEIDAGLVTITKGTLITVPICNPRAYEQHTRQAEENLNRVIKRHDTPTAYEHHLANELTALIDDADIMLDLHSYSSGVRPFLFLDNDTPENRAFAQALGIPYWITGWDDLYADQPELNSGDTMSYVKAGGKTGILIECGQHEDPAAILHGYYAIRAALAHFGMTASYTALDQTPPQVNRLTAVITKDRDGSFAKPWQHLDPVKKGDVVINYADGSTLTAPDDGVVIMPAPQANDGSEWIYFGVAE